MSQNGRALHIVFPHQFLDSPEWFGVSTDEYFQVSITAMEESRILLWHRDKLKLSIISDQFLQAVFDHILGRDVVKKLMQVWLLYNFMLLSFFIDVLKNSATRKYLRNSRFSGDKLSSYSLVEWPNILVESFMWNWIGLGWRNVPFYVLKRTSHFVTYYVTTLYIKFHPIIAL